MHLNLLSFLRLLTFHCTSLYILLPPHTVTTHRSSHPRLPLSSHHPLPPSSSISLTSISLLTLLYLLISLYTSLSLSPPSLSSHHPLLHLPNHLPYLLTSPPSSQAQLVMQVLQLSESQIAMLPPDQRKSIMLLKAKISNTY